MGHANTTRGAECERDFDDRAIVQVRSLVRVEEFAQGLTLLAVLLDRVDIASLDGGQEHLACKRDAGRFEFGQQLALDLTSGDAPMDRVRGVDVRDPELDGDDIERVSFDEGVEDLALSLQIRSDVRWLDVGTKRVGHSRHGGFCGPRLSTIRC